MQNFITSIVSFGGLLLVMGASNAEVVRYACRDNTQLSVTFSGDDMAPGTAHLVIVGTPVDVILPQVPSADGGRYAGSGLEFWIKGNSASLTRTGRDATTCHAR
jgi:membrane-bound inhibitor of C-type lysozyme